MLHYEIRYIPTWNFHTCARTALTSAPVYFRIVGSLSPSNIILTLNVKSSVSLIIIIIYIEGSGPVTHGRALTIYTHPQTRNYKHAKANTT